MIKKQALLIRNTGCILLLLFCLQALPCLGQHAHFVENGEIEYEKKVNIYARLQIRIDPDDAAGEKFVEEYRNTQPQFYTERASLIFSKDKSIYSFLNSATMPTAVEAGEPWVIVKNTVYRDFAKDSVLTIKQIQGDEFLINDNRNAIVWKLTPEERDIAGYKCRRANGIIQDSVYLVAFYAENIIPSGGPENFSGLPGMILGVALPHEHISWFATKVLEKEIPTVVAPVKQGKKAVSTRDEFVRMLRETTRNWGKQNGEALKAFSM